MMNRTEHLLSCLAEECCEVGHRVSKALRFSLAECQRGQPLSNAQRISEELTDLVAVAKMLRDAGIIPEFENVEAERTKQLRVEAYMLHAQRVGALRDAFDLDRC